MWSFIGIDLAWRVDGNHSGVAVLAGDAQGVELQAISADLVSLDGVVRFVAEKSANSTVVAVDCPLVVANDTGCRPCERELGRVFGHYGASSYSTSRSRQYWDTGPRLVAALGKVGFHHSFSISDPAMRSGRWVFEVYPHPAMVRLFGLEAILPYKAKRKRSRDTRDTAFAELSDRIASLPNLRSNQLLAGLLGTGVGELRGAALKRHEDSIDALLCAYLAWHFWRWGGEKNEIFGTLDEGYIVVPQPCR